MLSDALNNFVLGFNLALIQSEVDLSVTGGVATSRQRALQGQAPYVVNAQFGFDDSGDTGSGHEEDSLHGPPYTGIRGRGRRPSARPPPARLSSRRRRTG